ncbi:MAG: protein jag [Peptoniphilus sp. oral taxon 375]|nr:protein jag [Peptoniphilus sp. oral taxon 375]
MSYVITSADSVEKAIEDGLKKLNTTRDKVEVEILQEASKGFLGLIGSKEATVKLTTIVDPKNLVRSILQDEELDEIEPLEESQDSSQELYEDKKVDEEVCQEAPKEPETSVKEHSKQMTYQEKEEKILLFVEKLSQVFDLEMDTRIEEKEESLEVEILGDENKLGIVIGKRGVTLDAIQYLMTRMVNKDQDEYTRVLLDTSNYRAKREKTLVSLAEKTANKVLKTGRNIRLEPMNAAERRIIHSALQDKEGIMTYSEGRDPYRRVTIQKQRDYD